MKRESCIGGRFADMNGERRTLNAATWIAAFAIAASNAPPELFPVTQDINVLALVKGEERYIFLYDDEHKSDALRTLGRFASNSELSFSWYDAAVLSQRIRQTALEQRAAAEAETEVETEAEVEATAAVSPPRHKRFKLPLAE